jgi:hypothetical protein
MYAGSVKDICIDGDGYGMISYQYPKPNGARNFDVLKTPEEEGLQVGDIIHIKNLKTRHKDRLKVVGDLLTEAPITLTTKGIVEIEICHRKAREVAFNVHRPNISEPATFFKVYLASPNAKLWIY